MRAALRLLANLLRIVLWPLAAYTRARHGRTRPWLHLRLRGTVVDFAPPHAWWRRWLMGRVSPQTTAGLRRACRRIVEEGRVDGVLVEVWSLRAGWATCRGICEALSILRNGNVQVVVYLPQGADQRELLIAGCADRVVAAPHTLLRARGLAVSRPYLGALLRRLGVGVEVTAAGRYKTAAESLTREHMSEPEREQLGALLDSLTQQLQSEALSLGAQPMLRSESAREAGLLATVAYPDQLQEGLELPRERFPPARLSTYVRRIPGPTWRPLRGRPFVAVVPVHGVIAHGVGGPQRGVQLDPLVELLRSLAREDRVQAIVLHIDSPGGSAANSDLLHREVWLARQRKPVLAWFANVAASGGYYIACAAERIVADPMTLTGSIGVIGVKPVARTLLGSLGARIETVKTGPHADMDALSRPYDSAESAMVRDEVDALYARFVQVVAEGRGLPEERVRSLAGGRVYSGREAHAVQLVDRLGGEDAVREELASLLTERGADAAALGELRPVSGPLRPRAPRPPPGRDHAAGALTMQLLEPGPHLLADPPCID